MGRAKSTVDHQKFIPPLSNAEKYWLGFLLADGCIGQNSKNGNPQIILTLSDKRPVEKFASFMGVPENVNTNTYNGYERTRMTFRSKQIYDNLAVFGIGPNKTQTVEVDDRLESDRHFWRGVFDGDGHITIRDGLITIELVGNKKVITSFGENILWEHTGSAASIYHVRNKTYKLVTTGKYARKVAKILYEDSDVYMNRKKQVYETAVS